MIIIKLAFGNHCPLDLGGFWSWFCFWGSLDPVSGPAKALICFEDPLRIRNRNKLWNLKEPVASPSGFSSRGYSTSRRAPVSEWEQSLASQEGASHAPGWWPEFLGGRLSVETAIMPFQIVTKGWTVLVLMHASLDACWVYQGQRPRPLTAGNGPQVLQICPRNLAWACGSQGCRGPSHVFPPCWLCTCPEDRHLS